MNLFKTSLSRLSRGSAGTFRSFPATMLSAVLFVVVTAVRIERGSDSPDLSYLLTCLQWALAFGALFSLAIVTVVQTRFKKTGLFFAANLLGLAAAVLSFILLYTYGGMEVEYTAELILSSQAAARMSAACFVSVLAFIIAASYPPQRSDFSRTFFMTQRAFFTALIYGLVIGGGSAAIAGAVQGLLYPDMSSNVYQYVGLLSGFIAFTIFVGYFPDFRRGDDDPGRQALQSQPRFVEILCEYILIPIMLLFTVVLLAWVVRILFSGGAPEINSLSGSVTGYILVGIWLQIMLTHYPGRLALLYRRFFPLALLLITAFSIWALANKIREDGLTDDSYFFSLVCIFAAVSAILLLLNKLAHQAIAVLAAVLVVISVLPAVGADDLPVRIQLSRLERILQREGILSGGILAPAAHSPDESVRAAVTASVDFLIWQDERKLPDWLEDELRDPEVFEETFGFPMTYVDEGGVTDRDIAYNLYLTRPAEPLDISNYDWALEIEQVRSTAEATISETAVVTGERGDYYVELLIGEENSASAELTLYLDGTAIIVEDLTAYFEHLISKYPQGERLSGEAAFEDMSLLLETDEAAIWIIFETVNIYESNDTGKINSWLEVSQIYLREY